VQNLGEAPADGTWVDSVYLTSGTAMNSSAVLVSRVNVTENVAGGSSYSETLTAPIPGVAPGNYHVVVICDSEGLVPDVNRDNNTLVSSSTIAVSIPTITLGGSISGTIANGQDIYYQITLPAGHDVQVTGTFGAMNAAELLAGYQYVPSLDTYDDYAFAPNQPQQGVLLAATQAGTYYIHLNGQYGAGSGTSFTLTTVDLPFGVRAVSPSTGGNIGQTTVTITGTQLSPATVVNLIGPDGTSYPAYSTVFQNGDTVFATFDLTGLDTGTYGVQVVDQGRKATDAGAFTVTTGGGGEVVYNMSAPEYVRDGTMGTVTVTYENIGTTDALAPLLALVASNADVRLPDQSSFGGSTAQFLAINPTGAAGVLPPGALSHITFYFQASSTAAIGSQISFQLGLTSASTVIDWASVEDSFRPSYISASAWAPIWSNFLASVGSTEGSLEDTLDRDATYLSQLGEYNDDVNSLIGFELEKANDFIPVTSLPSSVDASSPSPGLPLTFSRQLLPMISGRYQSGPLGQGWTDNWAISASTDSQGNVTVSESGAIRVFTLQSNGSYQAEPGDYGVLTLSNGAYQLREKDGTLIAFNTNGSLNYEEDTNGNRITAGYTGSLLISLTESNGEAITLSYNSAGLISQVTDAEDRTTTYSYDSNDQLLLSVSNAQGTTQYSYVTGQGAADQYALASITNPNNAHVYFQYDAEGRLVGQSLDGNAEAVTYTYGAGAEVTSTDALDIATTTLFNEYGQPGLTIDARGLSTEYEYNSNQNLVKIIGPGGTTYTYAYDGIGNLLSETDPLGNTTNYTYTSQLDQLASSTDPNGNTTRYSYSSTGSLLNIAYPNGTQEEFGYDPLGNLTDSIDGNDNPIYYQYNSNGQLVREDFSDGTSVEYSYDSHGNIISATNSTGTYTLAYNAADQLIQITDPDHDYLKFTYNSGGERTQSVDQTGFTINYQYNAIGQLDGLTDGNGNMIVTYIYDADGRLLSKKLGNGTSTVYTYDPDNNVLSITNYAAAQSIINSYDIYTYNDTGSVLSDISQDGEWAYTYDLDGELTQAVFTPNSTDPDGITSQNLQYSYDAAGNRISEIVNGTLTSYVVNNMNEYTSSTTTGVGTTTYQYDNDGNLISQINPTSTISYTFNLANQLTAVNGPGVSDSYAYDPFNNLISQSVNGIETGFQVDPIGLGNVVATYNSDGVLTSHYTYGLELVGQNYSNNMIYYDFDLSGNTTGITGSSGVYLDSYSYLPFGQAITSSGTVSNLFTFSGSSGVIANNNGLDYMRARYYCSATGQFVSPDPLGAASGATNLRQYALNNPVSGVDPTGKNPLFGAVILSLILNFGPVALNPSFEAFNQASEREEQVLDELAKPVEASQLAAEEAPATSAITEVGAGSEVVGSGVVAEGIGGLGIGTVGLGAAAFGGGWLVGSYLDKNFGDTLDPWHLREKFGSFLGNTIYGVEQWFSPPLLQQRSSISQNLIPLTLFYQDL
jgi:RHS repeat-associated protein